MATHVEKEAQWRTALLGLILGFVLGLSAGSYVAFREAVRTDYEHCATELRSRDEANDDVKKTDPMGFYEYCGQHADQIWGGRGWR